MTLLNPYISFGTGRSFFVDPAGNDSNPGTMSQPWQTFTYAVTQLIPGDTLIAEGGTYLEADIVIAASGTAGNPITIQAKEGETAIIDGALAAYKTVGNSAWEVFDAGRNIWRTVATLASPGDFGYTGRIDVDGELYALTAYQTNDNGTGLAFLSADDDLYTDIDPYYMGPGVTYHSDGRVYIRLDPNSAEAQWDGASPVSEEPFVIAELDPRNHAIYLAPNNNAFVVDGDYIVIDGIDLHHHWGPIAGSGNNLTVTNATILPGRFGVQVGGDGWTFDNVTIDHDRGPWLARSDVKSFPEAAKDSRTCGVDWGASNDGQFINGAILKAFDGMIALADNTGIRFLNNLLDHCIDDGLQMGVGTYDFEFGYNVVTGAGPSHDTNGIGDTPDTVYIHHNVFDNTNLVFWARKPVLGVDPAENGDEGYHPAPIFSGHGTSTDRDPWKLYNNTFQSKVAPGQQGVNHYLYGGPDGQGVHEAYNNIINYNAVTQVYRGEGAASGFSIYDYNIYARTTPLEDFAIQCLPCVGDLGDFATFSDWKTAMQSCSTAYYAAGWDANSVELTTMVALDGDYQPAIGGPADGTGLDLSATGWPGTTPGTTYIGAKAPV